MRPGRFSSREIALLGLMAALWGVVEVAAGGMVKAWHIPFGGSGLAACGVLVLLTARASVPRRWSSLLVGIATAGIRLASGFGGALFSAAGILAEAVIVEAVLSTGPYGSRPRRTAAGALAVLWSLAHPFVVQGYLAGLGPVRVYRFTIAPLLGGGGPTSARAVAVIAGLALAHAALGVVMALFVDRVLLAPGLRAQRRSSASGDGAEGSYARRRGSAVLPAVVAALTLAASALPARAQSPAGEAPPQAEASAQPRTSDAPPDTARPAQSAWAFHSLPEYTVFGTRLHGPYAVYDVTPEDIRDAGAQDLSEALELVPGTVVRFGSRGEPRLFTRGLGEREVAVVVDGVPVSDPYAGTVNIAALLAGGLGSVRMTKGPAASIYGANALGGVIEITTPWDERPGLRYMVSAGTDSRYSGYLSGGGLVGAVRLGGGVAARGSSDFSLPGSFSAAPWEDGGRRDHSDRDDVFAWARAAWDPTERTTAALSFQVTDGRRDVPSSTIAERPRFWTFPVWRESRAVGSWSWRPGGVSLEARVFHSTNDNTLASYADADRTELRWLSSIDNTATGAYVYSEWDGGGAHRISAGLNVRADKAGIQSDTGEDWREHDATTASLFGQDVVVLGERDQVSVAANLDVLAGSGHSLARLNPQAAWTHALGGAYHVRVLGGTKTRFPTLKEWFSPDMGNPDLDPEQCVSGEVELVRTTGPDSRISLLAFVQDVTDMIESSGSGDPARNIGSVTTAGGEFAVHQAVSSQVAVDFGVTLTSARDEEADEPVPLIPSTLFTAAATYESGPVRCTARAVRVGSRPGESGEDLDSYYLADARASYRTRRATFFVGAKNLFDTLYEDEEGFPQPGRSFEFGIQREFFE